MVARTRCCIHEADLIERLARLFLGVPPIMRLNHEAHQFLAQTINRGLMNPCDRS